jgi:hypothetical protein
MPLNKTPIERRSKSNLAFLDFKLIKIKETKYLPTKFNGDIIFKLPPLLARVPSTYGRSMDGMDKEGDCTLGWY